MYAASLIILGMFLGAPIGLMACALCVAAKSDQS